MSDVPVLELVNSDTPRTTRENLESRIVPLTKQGGMDRVCMQCTCTPQSAPHDALLDIHPWNREPRGNARSGHPTPQLPLQPQTRDIDHCGAPSKIRSHTPNRCLLGTAGAPPNEGVLCR
jgi:hypothetical protein